MWGRLSLCGRPELDHVARLVWCRLLQKDASSGDVEDAIQEAEGVYSAGGLTVFMQAVVDGGGVGVGAEAAVPACFFLHTVEKCPGTWQWLQVASRAGQWALRGREVLGPWSVAPHPRQAEGAEVSVGGLRACCLAFW